MKRTLKTWALYVGGFVLGSILIGVSIGVPAAIMSTSGLAVAQTNTLWNYLKDSAVGQTLTNGVASVSVYMYNGTDMSQVRGTAANGLQVDPTRFPSIAGVSPIQAGTLLNSQNVSAADTILTKTLTGVASTRIHVYKIRLLCSPTGSSSANISDGAVLYAVNGGSVPAAPQSFEEIWPAGLTGTTGVNVVISVASCGPGNVSVLDVAADQF